MTTIIAPKERIPVKAPEVVTTEKETPEVKQEVKPEWEYAISEEEKHKADYQIRKGVNQDWELQKEGLETESPLFWAAADALGLNRNTANNDSRELTDIINMSVKILGFTDPEILFKFISHQAARSGKSYRSIKMRLNNLLQEF